MPAPEGKQLKTAYSNISRYVIKIRKPVEATYGILKQKYKLLY